MKYLIRFLKFQNNCFIYISYIYLKRKNIDFKTTWEVLKRAQPIADGNNPVCRLYLKEPTAVVYKLKKEGCSNKEKIHIVLSVYEKTLKTQ